MATVMQEQNNEGRHTAPVKQQRDSELNYYAG